MNVTERHVIDPTLFQRVYDNKLENSSVHVQNSRCAIKICGFTMGLTSVFLENNPHASGECTLFSKPVTTLERGPITDQFQLTAVTCACKKPDYHDWDCLNFDYCSMLPVPPYLCANLYEEDKCKTCVYKEIGIKHGETFKTQNSAVINSVNVRENCTLIRTTYGEMYRVERRQEFFNLGNHIIDPNYYKQSPDFACFCDNVEEPQSSSTSISSNSSINSNVFERLPEFQKLKSSPKSAILAKVMLGTVTFILVLSLAFCTCLSRKIISRAESTTTHLSEDGAHDDSSKIKDARSDNIPKRSGNVAIEMSDFKASETRALHINSGFEDYANFEFFINPQFLRLGEHVGGGNFGTIYEGIANIPEQTANRRVALKILKEAPFQIEDEAVDSNSSLRKEMSMISRIGKHPNVVEFLGISAMTTPLYAGKLCHTIVMELCGPKNLKDHLVSLALKRRLAHFSVKSQTTSTASGTGYSSLTAEPGNDTELFTMMVKWSKEIASGMEYLHTQNVRILHKDLAARNVLLSSCGNFVAKVSDFGLSRKLYDKNYYRISGGTMAANWSAPECISGDYMYTFGSDVWSYGVTVWEIFSLGNNPRYPVKSRNPAISLDVLSKYLKNGQRLGKPAFSTTQIYDKIRDCWALAPESRPSFNEIVRFFEDLH